MFSTYLFDVFDVFKVSVWERDQEKEVHLSPEDKSPPEPLLQAVS